MVTSGVPLARAGHLADGMRASESDSPRSKAPFLSSLYLSLFRLYFSLSRSPSPFVRRFSLWQYTFFKPFVCTRVRVIPSGLVSAPGSLTLCFWTGESRSADRERSVLYGPADFSPIRAFGPAPVRRGRLFSTPADTPPRDRPMAKRGEG